MQKNCNELSYHIVKIFRYPPLRVAYIDEREATIDGRSQKVYYSVLVKGGEKLDEVTTISMHKIGWQIF